MGLLLYTDHLGGFSDDPGWGDAAIPYYRERVLPGRIQAESYLRKLQHSLMITKISADSLPPHDYDRIFGGRDASSWDSLWQLPENEYTLVFYHCQRCRYLYETMPIYLLYGPEQPHRQFVSTEASLTHFIEYDRGFDLSAWDTSNPSAIQHAESMDNLFKTMYHAFYPRNPVFLKMDSRPHEAYL